MDPGRFPYRGMLMCHMWADTREELMQMADRIGVSRIWVQEPPAASWIHFDVCQKKRSAAIRAGAIPTDRYGASEHVARLKGNAAMLETIARLRARKSP